ncbi:MAG: AAA family ATPase [Oscillospiraceae bacterium]|nr:AAA family ATPase [Oscillospiraceae bacterium]
MGQVIALTSGKGGTGKTTICAGLATCLAAEGSSVLCIDADIGLRNLDISLGMRDTAPISFVDVLKGRNALSEATPHPDIPNLRLLTAPFADRPETVRFQDFGALLDTAREHFDFTLIDASAGLRDGFHFAAAYADRILVIATPDPASLRDAAEAADQLARMGKENVRLIVNRVTPAVFRSLRWTVDDLMDEIGLPLQGLIPDDPDVVLAAAHNRPLILCTDRRAALGCLHVARRLRGEKVPLLRIH